jgi:hypothetical protein
VEFPEGQPETVGWTVVSEQWSVVSCQLSVVSRWVPHPWCHPEQLDSSRRVESRDERVPLPPGGRQRE